MAHSVILYYGLPYCKLKAMGINYSLSWTSPSHFVSHWL